MAAAAGLFNQTTAQAMAGARARSMVNDTSDTSSTSSDSSATISADDFLTLLVTELQNQDPTADTDPNEYVNQLVEVNSLEQLININQTLTGALGDSDSSSSQVSHPAGYTANSPMAQTAANPSSTAAGHSATSASAQALDSIANRLAPGNLSAPQTNAAAQRVAHALDGQSSTTPAAGILSAVR